MDESDSITIDHDGPVTVIGINRPTRRNALDARAAAALHTALRSHDSDPGSKVAVLHGHGGSFCAGADLKEMSDGASYRAWAGDSGGMLGAPLGKPLIGAVSGHAVAGGLGVALYCDIRIADESAVFGVFCRRFGVPMSDGTTVRLPRLIGEARALDMMLTGRAVDADEALTMGLVAEVTPTGDALARAIELAHQLARLPMAALLSDRRSVLESAALPLDAALRHEAALAEDAKRRDAAAGAARFTTGLGRHGRQA